MNIKFDPNLIKDKLKERKKEIIVIAIYFVIFAALMFCLNQMKVEKADLEFDENLKKMEYDRLKSSNLSEDSLREEFKQISEEIAAVREQLPYDLKIQDINIILADIIANTGNMFNLGNCSQTELKNNKDYVEYEVRITSLSGTHHQFKNLLNYINEYKVKATVTQIDVARINSNIQGSMTIVFHGQKQSEA